MRRVHRSIYCALAISPCRGEGARNIPDRPKPRLDLCGLKFPVAAPALSPTRPPNGIILNWVAGWGRGPAPRPENRAAGRETAVRSVCFAELRMRVSRAPGHYGQPGRGHERRLRRNRRQRRRRSEEARILGPPQPRLPGQEEPQGALYADEHRGAGRRGARDAAHHAPQCRRAARIDPAGRRAEREPVDNDAAPRGTARPRRAARPARRRAPDRESGSRREGRPREFNPRESRESSPRESSPRESSPRERHREQGRR